jgi:hypothetical protein|tara:strand:- start:267 stop:704 length:438 start_codon:yes stop_codon:yes gene_type:complete
MVSLRYITSKELIIMVELLEVGIGYAAIFMPVLITGVILFFGRKIERDKYNAIIEVSKNLKDPSEIKELLGDLKKKKEPIDYRRSGVITLFVGIGLFLFGIFFIDILKGVGLLVGTIGVGSLIAGYLYPNESAEITKAVENFEKK